MKNTIEVTEEEWNKIAYEFSARQARHTRSMAEAMDKITRYMSQYKIVKSK